MSLIEELCAKLMFEMYIWVHDLVLPWILGWCMWKQIGNLVFSPKRAALAWAKTSRTHPCHCMRSRLGELVLAKRETLFSKRNNLVWARVHSDFWVAHCLEPRLGENDPPKRDSFSPRRYRLAWVRTTTEFWSFSILNVWSYI